MLKSPHPYQRMKTNCTSALLFAVCVWALTFSASAQVGIGTTTPHSSAKLEVAATDKGFLPPRVALTGTDDGSTVSSPATGLLVYNTATAGATGKEITPGLYTWNGSVWERLSANNPNGQDIGYIVGWGSTATPPDYLLPLNGGTFNWSDYPHFQTLHADFPSAFVVSSTATTFTLDNLNTTARFLRGGTTPGVDQDDATALPTTAFTAASAGAHTHDVNPAAVTSSSDGIHSHTVDPAAVTSTSTGDHWHTTDPSGFSSGGAGGHDHTYNDAYFAENSAGTVGGNGQFGTSAPTDWDNSFRWRTWNNGNSVSPSSIWTSWVGDHTHWIDVPSTGSSTTGAHTHSVDVASTTSSNSAAHTHTVDVAATTSTSNGDHTHTITGGDSETRPLNTSVVWCLKVKSTSTSGAISVNSGATSATNGLTLSNNAVELGGTLTKSTTIQSGGNALILGGSAQLGVGKTPSQAIDVNGNIAASGTIRGAAAGSILNMVFVDESVNSLGANGVTITASGNDETVLTYNYTPVSATSLILIEFDADFSIPGNHGGVDDALTSKVKVAGTSVQSKTQQFRKVAVNAQEWVEMRSPTLFPISGRYLNASTSAVAITITVARTSGDDGATIGNDYILKITEIAR
jgi:hypothetical protein